jgi:anti-sigma-K factor RskA
VSDIHALSGAYAIDALDDLERAAFERHLLGCDECRSEVAGLRETAGLLAETTAAEPPAALRDRVLAEIATVRPLPPAAPTPTRRPRRFRLMVVAAAAAVLAVLGVGAAVWHPWTDDSSTTVPTAQRVLDAPDATSETLPLGDGATATVTRSDSVGKAVIQTHELPPLPADSVYQLWLRQPGAPDSGMVSAGLMSDRPDQTVVLEGDAATATAAGITVEPEGGSDQPTTDPIALFDFKRGA